MVLGILVGDTEAKGGGGDDAGDASPPREEVLLVGTQFIVPKVDVTDGGVQRAQDMHTDIPRKGELLSVAVNAHGNFMGTLFDPLGTAFNRSDFLGRADSSAFAYDSGSLHCGPGRSGVPGPYPAFDVSRVFFMIVSPSLSPARVAAHQQNNRVSSPPVLISLEGCGLHRGRNQEELAPPDSTAAGVGRTPKQAQAPARKMPPNDAPPCPLLPAPPGPFYLVEQPGRGRCAIVAQPLRAGATLDALSGPPYAACALRALEDGVCERCLRDVSRSDGRVSAESPRGCRAVYCSPSCHRADHRDHVHEASLQRAAASSPLGRHAASSEDLSASQDADALDRFGLLLLAVRCLWRRHRG